MRTPPCALLEAGRLLRAHVPFAILGTEESAFQARSPLRLCCSEACPWLCPWLCPWRAPGCASPGGNHGPQGWLWGDEMGPARGRRPPSFPQRLRPLQFAARLFLGPVQLSLHRLPGLALPAAPQAACQARRRCSAHHIAALHGCFFCKAGLCVVFAQLPVCLLPCRLCRSHRGCLVQGQQGGEAHEELPGAHQLLWGKCWRSWK